MQLGEGVGLGRIDGDGEGRAVGGALTPGDGEGEGAGRGAAVGDAEGLGSEEGLVLVAGGVGPGRTACWPGRATRMAEVTPPRSTSAAAMPATHLR